MFCLNRFALTETAEGAHSAVGDPVFYFTVGHVFPDGSRVVGFGDLVAMQAWEAEAPVAPENNFLASLVRYDPVQ